MARRDGGQLVKRAWLSAAWDFGGVDESCVSESRVRNCMVSLPRTLLRFPRVGQVLTPAQEITECLYSKPSPIWVFAFRGFSYPWSTVIRKYEVEDSRSISFTFVIDSDQCDEVPSHEPCPTQGVTHPLVRCIHTICGRPPQQPPLSPGGLLEQRSACIILLSNGPNTQEK